MVIPLAIGAAGVTPLCVLLLNLGGALIWAVAFAFGGYYLGQALEVLLVDLGKYEILVILAIVVVAGLVWLGHLWRRHGRAA